MRILASDSRRAIGLAAALVMAMIMGLAAAAWADDSFDPAFDELRPYPKPTEVKPFPSTDVKAPAVETRTPEVKTTPTEARIGPAPAPTPEGVQKMLKYFLDMYSKSLAGDDWVAKATSVISLAMIDDPQMTAKLLDVAVKDEKPLVRIYAWEALHARRAALTADQQKRWAEVGQELFKKNLFRGQLRVGMVGMMRAEGPTDDNQKRFMELFFKTNSMDPNDISTLAAMQDTLAEWRSPEIIKQLVMEMSNLDNAYRAEYLLWPLNSGVPAAVTHVDKGSQVMWSETQAAWVAWLGQANLKAKTEGLQPYSGLTKLMPAGEKIVDPHAPRWHKDLELGKLYLDQLDVGFAVDSTGSMTEVIRWIQRDVMRLMRACGMLAREPRIGITFYRDHGDEYLTRSTPLTDKGEQLAAAISGVTAKGGGDEPEAVLDGLQALINANRWSGGDRAKKVIILVGDAMPHATSMGEIQKLVDGSAKGGFRFFAVKAHTRYGSSDLSSFDQIATWGKGKAIDVNFYDQQANVVVGNTGIALASDEDSPYDQVMREVVASIIPSGYHDRVPYFVKILMQYVDEPVLEKRKAFPPKPSPPPPVRRVPGERGPGERGPGERVPHDNRPPPPPPKPFDPQAR